MAYSPTAHASDSIAKSEFINKLVASGYVPATGVSITGLLYSIVANFLTSAVGVPNASTFITYTPSLTPAQVNANTTAEQTFTVTGLLTGDRLLSVVKPTAQAGLGIVGFRISASDTLAITFSNNTGSPITPTAGQTYVVVTTRP